ncbi:CotH kinase family protein [Ligilactobacillus agilis]|uniref:CotH kinase family protein n=1 Tax=Ligilactobacillus agilis TaxID=1601 RepID=UPI001866E4E2|nr:CotH kinase family protein [Ligilactobacillus agilis]
MTVEYRDDTPFGDNLHSLDEIADALRHKKFGKDVREAIAQAVEKLYGIGPNTVVSGSPAGAYATLSDLQSAYPNGQQGVFVVAETGKWYIWNPRKNQWIDGGNFQSPMSQDEITDGRIWLDGTQSAKLGDAIRGQFEQEKLERKQDNELEKNERIQKDFELKEHINAHATALELKKVRLKDSQENLLWDGENYVTGEVYLPKTDKTGLEEGLPIDSSIIGYTFLSHLKEYGLPILKLEHPKLLSLNKADGKLKDVKFSYGNLKGELSTVKVQGATSAGFPKKNFTLKFKEPVLINNSWGKQNKYVIKGDWVDFSHMRNEFGAHVWGQLRKDRFDSTRNQLVDKSNNSLTDKDGNNLVGETIPQFTAPNYGAIDSFPIFVNINGIYWGLYSLTVPKDDWMASMGGGSKEAIVSAENHSAATRFLKHVEADSQGNLAGSDFSVEYVSDEGKQQWVVESLNRAIDSVISTTGSVEGIREYIDIDSATDYFILNALLLNSDAFDKNFLLQTWDGKKWFFAAYDMDATFGNRWDGKAYYRADWLGFKEQESLNRVFHLIYTYDRENFIKRWETLRNGSLSNENLSNLIYNYAITIPKAAFDYEAKRWPGRPGTTTNNVNQIQNWLVLRLNFLDKEINDLRL